MDILSGTKWYCKSSLSVDFSSFQSWNRSSTLKHIRQVDETVIPSFLGGDSSNCDRLRRPIESSLQEHVFSYSYSCIEVQRLQINWRDTLWFFNISFWSPDTFLYCAHMTMVCSIVWIVQ